MKIISLTCSHDCFGIDNYHGSCCRLENRDFIIGPIHDTDDFLTRLQKHFNRPIAYKDVFIDYEEGSKLFPDKTTWQNREAFPALRIDLDSKDLHCIFYNNTMRACSVYNIRPTTCYRFVCDYLKNKIQNEAMDQR
jgi:Fe-S-cluster containining protein